MAGTANSTGPGLIVFLPLVAAFVGAIIGAWANSWYRNREAKKAEDREREGLLLLIGVKLAVNNMVFESTDRSDIASHLSTAVWDESRVRLAQLLPIGDIGRLAFQHSVTKQMRNYFGSHSGEVSEAEKKRISRVRTLGYGIMKDMQEHITDTTMYAVITTLSQESSEDSEEANAT